MHSGISRLVVIIPALNESASIEDVVRRVPRTIPNITDVEIVVVDDGSTDNTRELALAAGANVVSHVHNRGLGRAIQTGLSEAVRRRATYAVNIDADGQFAPEDIPSVLAPVIAADADMATASRFKEKALVPRMPTIKRWGNAGMAWLISSLSGPKYYDVSCGFRAYSCEAILRLVLTGRFTYTQEMFLALAAHGLRIVEVPLAVRGTREHGKSRIASSLFRYAVSTLTIIFGALRDYRPQLFFGAFFLILAVPGIGLGGFFAGHRIVSGSFSPHLWAGFLSAFLIALAVFVFFVGQVAGMLNRARILQEEQLYILRKMLREEEW